MKFLIIPGFAKAGTTFLYEQLRESGAPINFPKRKELNYFCRPGDLDGYLDQFETRDPDKVFLDASPLYSLDGAAPAKHMTAALKGHDVKFIFGLRDPIRRAYSHYMHDISTHFFLYSHAPYSFYSADVLRKYFRPMAPVVESFTKAFGVKNVSGFGFKATGPDLRADILSFLGLDKTWKLDFDVNPAEGSSLPRIYYDTDRELTVRSGEELYALPPRTFLIANIRFQQFRPDFPEPIARLLMKNAASWDRQFDPQVLGSAIEIVRDDYKRCFDMLKMTPEILSEPKTVSANEPPPLTPQIRGKMEKLGRIDDTLNAAFEAPPKLFKKLAGKGSKGPQPAEDKFQSVPAVMKSLELAVGKSGGSRAHAYERALTELGPVPDYVRAYLRHLISLGDTEKITAYLQSNPNLGRYVSFRFVLESLDAAKDKFTPEDYKTLGLLMGRR